MDRALELATVEIHTTLWETHVSRGMLEAARLLSTHSGGTSQQGTHWPPKLNQRNPAGTFPAPGLSWPAWLRAGRPP